MFEFTQSDKLIKGEKYVVKRKQIYGDIMTRHYYSGIFHCYNEVFEGSVWFKYLKNRDDSEDKFLVIEIDLSQFYRFVSKEEFYKKVKEKYDHKCLNIILKRLIDESFQW